MPTIARCTGSIGMAELAVRVFVRDDSVGYTTYVSALHGRFTSALGPS